MESISEIAKKRVDELLEFAIKTYKKDKTLAKKYVVLARKVASSHRIKTGNKRFCKKCNTIYIPGITVKVRQSAPQKATLYICLSCNNIRKFSRI